MADPIIDPKRVEALGPAEHLIQALLTHSDHMVHNRPGIVIPAPGTPTGVRWEYSTYKVEGEAKERVAYFIRKVGKKSENVRAGIYGADGKVREGGRIVGEYRQPGLFPEVAAWVYRKIADIYKLDNEFVARWASHAFGEEHKDLKVALAAFLLVQTRRGDPVVEDGKVLFLDEDYRDVGEAMCLIRRTDKRDFNPKLLLRVEDLLRLPAIAAINRELGFSRSAKNPTTGRWDKTVTKFLRNLETNPGRMNGFVKSGARTGVIELAQRVHYKPSTPRFFQALRWKQEQAKDGRRGIAIGDAVADAESWEGMTEAEVCARIIETKPSYKRIVGLLPKGVGITRAVVAASVEAGAMSDQDLIIATPTLEDLGLLGVEPVKSRWEAAVAKVENQRAANIAARVKNTATKEKLVTAAETAVTKAVAEVMRGVRLYFMVDISGSMHMALEMAKEYVGQLISGFPADKLHVAVFHTSPREVLIKHPSKAGVEAAFKGIQAGGGTDYGAGVRGLQGHKPGPDEDAIFLFIGDEQHPGNDFSRAVQASGINPVAFGLLKVGGSETDRGVRNTAVALGIPCFLIDKNIFSDPYALPRTLRNLIAATPVGKIAAAPGAVATSRVTLVEQVLKTDLLVKPAWARAA